MNKRFLNVPRERHRKPVYVDLIDVHPFGLEIQLMSLPVREPHDLVFQRRAVPRSDSLNLSVEERTLANSTPHEIADTIVGVQQPAAHAVARG